MRRSICANMAAANSSARHGHMHVRFVFSLVMAALLVQGAWPRRFPSITPIHRVYYRILCRRSLEYLYHAMCELLLFAVITVHVCTLSACSTLPSSGLSPRGPTPSEAGSSSSSRSRQPPARFGTDVSVHRRTDAISMASSGDSKLSPSGTAHACKPRFSSSTWVASSISRRQPQGVNAVHSAHAEHGSGGITSATHSSSGSVNSRHHSPRMHDAAVHVHGQRQLQGHASNVDQARHGSGQTRGSVRHAVGMTRVGSMQSAPLDVHPQHPQQQYANEHEHQIDQGHISRRTEGGQAPSRAANMQHPYQQQQNQQTHAQHHEHGDPQHQQQWLSKQVPQPHPQYHDQQQAARTSSCDSRPGYHSNSQGRRGGAPNANQSQHSSSQSLQRGSHDCCDGRSHDNQQTAVRQLHAADVHHQHHESHASLHAVQTCGTTSGALPAQHALHDHAHLSMLPRGLGSETLHCSRSTSSGSSGFSSGFRLHHSRVTHGSIYLPDIPSSSAGSDNAVVQDAWSAWENAPEELFMAIADRADPTVLR